MSLIFMVVVVGGMMFFMNRSQKKAQQQRQEQLNSMVIGAEIVTIGGLHGVLSGINEADATIELDCEGVILTFDRAAVKTVKTTLLQHQQFLKQQLLKKLKKKITQSKNKQ